MYKNHEYMTPNVNGAFQIRAIGQQLELLARVTKKLKNDIELM
jgi:hypothetical protein